MTKGLSVLPKEQEWLLLPNAVLQVDGWDQLEIGEFGNPPATKWVLVHATQTK